MSEENHTVTLGGMPFWVSPDASWTSIGEAGDLGECPQCNHKLHVMIRSVFEGKFRLGCPVKDCGYLTDETHAFCECPDGDDYRL